MPTYEYLCQSCSHRFETWQKMSDEPLKVCPECGKEIRRVLFPAGIVFKGSGFYVTDHGSSSHALSSNGENKKSESNASSEKSGESKASSEGSTSKSSNESTTAPNKVG
ncbi:MAG: zinc ribbon domain-containing protein [Ktedonobacteraceae bacterium]|nr:zinc ribbon domain-containing protein [Ktedonobacteraceae bacterium]MBO0795052.1 zinc ribbon domain-containing protein [Ktedonobacteraceae bacterium]